MKSLRTYLDAIVAPVLAQTLLPTDEIISIAGTSMTQQVSSTPPPPNHTPAPNPTSTNTPQINYNSSSGISYPTHTVEVGAFSRLLFNPAYVTADIGDVVRFFFRAGNHTLTQSRLDNPCSPAGGFNTDFRQLNLTNSSDLTVDLFVDKTDPQ